MKNGKEIQNGQSVEEYVAQIRKEYEIALAERDERIACLIAENIKLKETIARSQSKEESNDMPEEDFELDMQKILHPDNKLELAVLCRDLGLMDDEN